MNLLEKKTIPADVLSEMEALQIKGGAGSEDVHVYAIDSCSPHFYGQGAYCGNCVAQCGCGDSGEKGDEGGSTEKP